MCRLVGTPDSGRLPLLLPTHRAVVDYDEDDELISQCIRRFGPPDQGGSTVQALCPQCAHAVHHSGCQKRIGDPLSQCPCGHPVKKAYRPG
jgi:hypothetical protein